MRNKGLALHQQLQTLHNIRCCRSQHLTDDVVASGGLPKCFGTAVVVEVSNDRPGIKNLGITEAVPIIPIAELLILIRCAVVFRHLTHFVRGETKILTITFIQDGVDFQVVQAAEDTLLCNTQDAGQEAIAQMRIVLQTAGKQIAHKSNDSIIETVHMSLLDGSIVFVNDDDGGNIMVLMKQQRQCPQGHLIIHFISSFCCENGVFLFFVITERRTGGQFIVTAEFLRDQLLERLIGFFPRSIFHVLKSQKNHRILSVMDTVGFSAEPDFLISEVNGSVLGRLFKECAEHVHVKRLAKTSGTGEQGYLGALIQKFLDHQGLVHIVVVLAGIPVIRHTNRQRFAHG